MLSFDLREPINAWSHGAGMILAVPITWLLWRRCRKSGAETPLQTQPRSTSRHQRIKAICLLIFGMSLIACYGISAVFHGVRLTGDTLSRLQRLDHVGIFFLIAGTYTPVAWGLMRGPWCWGTLTTVWIVALVCASRVWCGGVMPMWLSTFVYLAMGWGALFCYFELARMYSHRTLLPLPLGGVFYSVGAIVNLARWPVFSPGIFAAHELFHFFVIAGSACHIFFMIQVVVPARDGLARPPQQWSKEQLIEAPQQVTPRRGRWHLHFAARQSAADRAATGRRLRASR
jgi:hemolysin III